MLGEIACGVPKFANEDRESYVDAGTDVKADFCLKAKGDSMINARIHDGDIVFIHRQDVVENGEIAAVVINHDSEATLKRFYYYFVYNFEIVHFVASQMKQKEQNFCPVTYLISETLKIHGTYIDINFELKLSRTFDNIFI